MTTTVPGDLSPVTSFLIFYKRLDSPGRISDDEKWVSQPLVPEATRPIYDDIVDLMGQFCQARLTCITSQPLLRDEE